MKKFIAAAMATALLSTVALAGESYDITNLPQNANGINQVSPGDKIYILPSSFESEDGSNLPEGTDVTPGNALAVGEWEFNEDYFTITSKRFVKGASLVDKVEFDTVDNDGVAATFDSMGRNTSDIEALVIVLENNTSTDEIRTPNLIIDEISIRAKQDSGEEWLYNGDEYPFFEYRQEFTFAEETDVIVAHEAIRLDEFSIDDLEAYAGDLIIADFVDDPYSEGQFNKNAVYMYGRVYDGDKFIIDVNSDYIKEVLIANPDAEIEFANVEVYGLSASWNIELAADEDSYVYEMSNGRLVNTSLDWDEDYYSYKGKIRENTTYIISDSRLNSVDISTDNDNDDNNVDNPDTGAADVVGLATALAVVSLVGATAVYKKRK